MQNEKQSPIRARRLQLHHGRPVSSIALGLVPCSLGRLGRLREARRKSAIAAQGLSNPLKVEGQREASDDVSLSAVICSLPKPDSSYAFSAEIQKAGAAPPHGQDRFPKETL